MPTKVIIYPGAVERFIGTDVKRYVKTVASEAKDIAVATAPIRTGDLKARHYYRVRDRGSYIQAEVGNKSDHAQYVHEGTHGPIRPRSGGLLVFVSHGQLWKAKSVRGQRANPWLWRATRAASKAHGV